MDKRPLEALLCTFESERSAPYTLGTARYCRTRRNLPVRSRFRRSDFTVEAYDVRVIGTLFEDVPHPPSVLRSPALRRLPQCNPGAEIVTCSSRSIRQC